MRIDRTHLLLACALIATVTPAFAQPFPIHDVSPPGESAFLSTTAVDPQGNAIVIWSNSNLANRAARYVAATDTWGPPVDLIQSTPSPRWAVSDLAMDPAGNAVAVGYRLHNYGVLRAGDIIAARYSVATGVWTPFTVLFTGLDVSSPQVAVDAEGNATVVWAHASSIHVARYSPASGWSSRVLADNAGGPLFVALDAGGNATVTLGRATATGLSINAIRYAKGTATWEAEQVVATLGNRNLSDPAMAMDPQGNALLVWTRDFAVLEATRFNAATGTRSPVEQVASDTCELCTAAADSTGNFMVTWRDQSYPNIYFRARRYSSSSGSWGPLVTLSDHGTGEVVMDSNGNATAVWASSIGELGVLQGARFNAAAGAWSGTINLTNPAETSHIPFDVEIDSTGDVRIAWTKNRGSNSFVVQSTRWPAGVTPTGPPGAPVNLQATVSGSTVGLTWSPPTSGGAPTNYSLVARTTAGGPVLATVPMGLGTSFSVNAPTGTFVLSVRAENASGTGPESTSVTVTVPQSGSAPGAPSNLAASVTGSAVSFTWNPPTSGGAVANYLLIAGLTPAFSVPYATVPLGASPGFVVPGVPAGTFYVRIVAQNAAGMSPPSNEVTVTIAGPAAPGAPTLNAPVVSGSTVSLSWSPGSGGTPTSYTLSASATPSGAIIATAALVGTSVTFPGVPSGTYYLRMTASNAAGTSPPSAEVTLTVP